MQVRSNRTEFIQSVAICADFESLTPVTSINFSLKNELPGILKTEAVMDSTALAQDIHSEETNNEYRRAL